MTNDINAILYYLAGKNYFNGITEMNKALGNQMDYQAALNEIEAIDLVHTKTESSRRVYLLKQFAKDGIQNLPIEYSQDPYGYFKQLDLEKQRIIAEHKEYVGSLAKAQVSEVKKEKKSKIGMVLGMAVGTLATTIAFFKLRRTK